MGFWGFGVLGFWVVALRYPISTSPEERDIIISTVHIYNFNPSFLHNQ